MGGASLGGLLGVVLAAVLGGSVLAPMKFQRGWRFEHTWLIYSLAAYFTFPWLVALATTPHLFAVYQAVGFQVTAITALCGLGWGLAVILNGYAVTLVGMAVTTGVLMGASIALGSVAAVLLVEPARLWTAYGAKLTIVNAGLMGGVALCSWAGDLRERQQSAGKPGRKSGAARRGILLCLLAGVLSTLFNVALTYGQRISQQAEAYGASPLAAANAVWAIAVSAGSLPSLVWCVLAVRRRAAWQEFGRVTPVANTARCLLMATLWITSTVIYGAAARVMGNLGTALGWPVYMAGMIVTASAWGWLTGEWRGAEGRPSRIMMAGIAVLIALMAAMAQLQ